MREPSVAGRAAEHARLKLALIGGLGLLITAPYFATVHSMAPGAMAVPATWVDHAVAYSEPWAWVYVSLYVLLLVPALSTSRDAILRFAVAVTVACLVSHTLFVLLPTTATLPTVEPASALMKLIVAIDGPANACPSLHASLAIMTALAARPLFASRRVSAALWAWAAAVGIAALVTKRHVALDLLAGALVGASAWAISTAAAPRRRENSSPEGLRNPVARTTEEARALVARGLDAELRVLRALDSRKRAVEIAAFTALWLAGAAVTVACVASADTVPPLWLGAAVGALASAVALNAYVLLLHEGMHSTLVERPWLNHALSVVFGGLVLMSFSAYRVMHTRHHLYLGDPRDPDDYHNYTGNRVLVWCLHYVRLVVGTFLYIFLIPAFALRYGSRSDRVAIGLEYAILVPAWIAVATVVPLDILVAVWAIPVLVVAYFTSIRGFTQHGITVAEDPFLASRSIRPSRLVALCLLNENFHLEHHLFPEVPSYNLERLHDLLSDRIPYRVTGRSYLSFIGRFLNATPRMREEPIGLTVEGTE